MTFSLAVVIIAAVAVIALGLVVYNLLGRLHLLETAVHGGMQAPSRRLSREEFERQFSVAQARATLAAELDTGVVLFLDSGSTTARQTVATVRHLPRHDNVHLIACDEATQTLLAADGIEHRLEAELGQPLSALGVSTLPFCMIIDGATVRSSHHLGSPDALVEVLREFS